MTSTSLTSSKTDLAAVLHNVARRYGPIATTITIGLSGGSATITVTWPDEIGDPGDPGPDPEVVALGNALSQVTDNLVNEQSRISTLFAERIDLQAQRTELAKANTTLTADKATADQQLVNAETRRSDLESQLVAKQKEIDTLKGAAVAVAAAVKP